MMNSKITERARERKRVRERRGRGVGEERQKKMIKKKIS